MLNDEICKLREKLNDSILNEKDYNITYQISVELDQLIAEYYSTTQVKLIKTAQKGIKDKGKNSKRTRTKQLVKQ